MPTRLVILTGTMTFNYGLVTNLNIYDYESRIKSAFNNNGWDVINIRLSAQFPNTINITIEANVFVAHTAAEARQNAIAVLSSIQEGLIYQGSLFTNINLSVLSEGQPTQADHDATLDTTLKAITDATGELAKDVVKDAVKNATSNTGLYVALGLVAVVLILKR